ncbi:hypothetical protein PIB30_075856 [Stylosanthes scabra]|uniref:Uncharacterized protein n=1 Tax=Stylosanthes scabra TaxID=79078 RepID=A0ABU6WRP2_9FABA|nr:hypothetical protein [Stylosanthes scabra]
MRRAIALSFPGKSLVVARFHKAGQPVLLGFVVQAYKRESVNDVGHDRPAEVALVLLQTHHYPPAALGLHQMQTDARNHWIEALQECFEPTQIVSSPYPLDTTQCTQMILRARVHSTDLLV